MSGNEQPWQRFAPKFRTEYICLKCKAVRDDWGTVCREVLPNGRICGGPICPRFIRVYR